MDAKTKALWIGIKRGLLAIVAAIEIYLKD